MKKSSKGREGRDHLGVKLLYGEVHKPNPFVPRMLFGLTKS